MTIKFPIKGGQESFKTDSSLPDQIEEKELNLQDIAIEMKLAQDHCRKIAPFTSLKKEFGIADAYAVASMINKMRVNEGSVPVGRKIGFTNSEMWSVYGVDEPIWAYIYDTTVVRLNSQNTKCHIGRFSEPKIEPEVVLHFCSTPSFDAEPAEILDCIDWIAHGIEIVQSHFPGWKIFLFIGNYIISFANKNYLVNMEVTNGKIKTN